MNEQTKLELLKIAAQLTNTYYSHQKSSSFTGINREFEKFAFYLFENFDKLGTTEKISSE